MTAPVYFQLYCIGESHKVCEIIYIEAKIIGNSDKNKHNISFLLKQILQIFKFIIITFCFGAETVKNVLLI
jgi:hypothetical protein